MSPWKTLLKQNKLLISDGAWGTELTRRGLPPGEPPEGWNLDRPDDVRAVAQDYVAAGSDIILTNSFGASRPKLARGRLADRLAEINRAAVHLSKEAADGRVLVFASVGPTGELMAPLGPFSERDVTAAFAEQVIALAHAQPDAVLIETLTDLNEARAALRAVKDNSPLEVVISMTFDRGARGYATVMGVTPERAAHELADAGADAVGANCGGGIEQITDIIAAMRAVTRLPLWAKPNAGLPQLRHGKTVFPHTPEDMVRRLPQLVRAGANIIGGCCGSTPEHLRQIVRARPGLVASILAGFDPAAELIL